MRKSTVSASSSSSTYVSDDCNYQNSAYKGAVAAATTAAEIGVGLCEGAAFLSLNPACIAAATFATVGSGFSDTLDSQNLCTDYTMVALNDIANTLSNMQSQLSAIEYKITKSDINTLYGSHFSEIEEAAKLYNNTNVPMDIENNTETDKNWYDYVMEHTEDNLNNIEIMIKEGAATVTNPQSIYSSLYDQSYWCDPSQYEYFRLMLVQGYSQLMMAKQANYQDEVKAISGRWNLEVVQEDMVTALTDNKDYYNEHCPCLVTNARGPLCGEMRIFFS